jgi:hypothetical protein
VITIAGISDHLRPEWLITITGIRNQLDALAEAYTAVAGKLKEGRPARRRGARAPA